MIPVRGELLAHVHDPHGGHGTIEHAPRLLGLDLHGVGAQQFANYNPPGRVETWRETHNVVLQVAAL